jgi:hypothetical protein
MKNLYNRVVYAPTPKNPSWGGTAKRQNQQNVKTDAVTTNTSNYSPTMENKLQAAVLAYQNSEFKYISDCAKSYEVPYSLLRARLRSRNPTQGGHNKALLPSQEAALKAYLDRCIYLRRPSKKRYLWAAANTILCNSGIERIVSRRWTTRFLAQNPQYKKQRTKPLAVERQAAQERLQIEEHFQRFQAALLEHNIKKRDVWNFDETGFCISCLCGQLVLTHTNNKAVYIADPEN